MVWIKYENQLIIWQLKQDFLCTGTEYGMKEFAMMRSDFYDIPIPAEITVKGYQPLHFQEYLSLLDAAMTYHDTADFYSSRADEYREDFLNGDKEECQLSAKRIRCLFTPPCCKYVVYNDSTKYFVSILCGP